MHPAPVLAAETQAGTVPQSVIQHNAQPCPSSKADGDGKAKAMGQTPPSVSPATLHWATSLLPAVLTPTGLAALGLTCSPVEGFPTL